MTRKKRISLINIPQCSVDNIVTPLREADDKLEEPESIVLSITSDMLQEILDFELKEAINFEHPLSIGFCVRPSERIIKLLGSCGVAHPVFDFNAVGFRDLLFDFSDRMTEVDLGLKHLKVFCLSTRDWVVSKLREDALEDVFECCDVVLEDLYWIRENMHLYSGWSADGAMKNLSVLISEFESGVAHMEVFSGKELINYVEQLGGDLSVLDSSDCGDSNALSVITFYCLHFPERECDNDFWNRNVREAVTFLWDHLRVFKEDSDRVFRTPACKAYFQRLLEGYVNVHGLVNVYKFRHQNWNVVNCEQMVEQLWTVLEEMENV